MTTAGVRESLGFISLYFNLIIIINYCCLSMYIVSLMLCSSVPL